MKVTREELIYIHTTIWDYVLSYIKKCGGQPRKHYLESVKGSAICDMYSDTVVSREAVLWVYKNCSCALCALYSSDFCNGCPLQDCSAPISLYKQVLNGSEEACVKIRDSIYYAKIPQTIEIPED